MPNTFKSAGNKLTTASETTLYTTPSATTTILKSLYAGNIDAVSSVQFDVYITKSGSGIDVYVIKGAIIPIQSSLQVITEPIVLETGDVLKVKASVADDIDTFLSYMEIT